MSKSAQILVIDDHPLLRKGVLQLIDMDDELTAVGEASNGADGIRLAKTLDPDLILLDLNMRGMDGIATLKALREEGIISRIVIYSVSDNDEDVVEAMKSGADGYLLKDMEPEDLLERLKQAAIGKIVISEKLTAVLASALRAKPKIHSVDLTNLTGREKEILKLIAGGLSNKMIARKLDIAEGTVRFMLNGFLRNLDYALG